ncbi:SDR family oxidoreductase [Inquilinus sp. OTU3971]|uniref:SDR family oxidoreductase n=1 Tax=Inquilinus sp. OTU3971 TaxID=3043855 RepID=UPI00313CA820
MPEILHESRERPELSGRTALVTGASSGIGRAIALSFAEHGAFVVGVGRRADRLEELAIMIRRRGNRCDMVSGDLTDADFAARLVDRRSDLDILVNAAGVQTPSPFVDGAFADWVAMVNTNILGLLSVTQAAARAMVARRRGHIINIGSALGSTVFRNAVVYAATKHAVRAINTGLRLELAEHNIRVTEIAPGLVGDTEFSRSATHPDVVASFYKRPYAPISTAEVAAAALFAVRFPEGAEIERVDVKPIGQA